MPAILPEVMGYDRTIAVFSPDGRLFQVEYAKEAVKKGSTCIGLVFNGGVILATIKQETDLVVSERTEKLFKIDNHICGVAAGLLADARILVSQLRLRAQINKITYDEDIDVWSLARILGDRMQFSTLYAGLRPFGVSFLIGGVDSTGPHLMESDPSGMLYEWKAYTIGRGASIANKMLKDKYRDGMDEKSGLKLIKSIMGKTEKVKDLNKSLDIAIITNKNRNFKVLTQDDIKAI